MPDEHKTLEQRIADIQQPLVKVAVLDDYQNVALSSADWSGLDKRATITVFNKHLADPDAVVARLQCFDIVCVMRERTPMTRARSDDGNARPNRATALPHSARIRHHSRIEPSWLPQDPVTL